MKILAKKLEKLLNNELNDIIIFGSTSKGKVNPADLDLAILSDVNLNQLVLKKEVESIVGKAHLTFYSISDFDKLITLTLIKEGYSVKHQRYLFEVFGIDPVVLFNYSLKKLTPSQRVMFYRGLNKFKDLKKLSNRVVLVPIKVSSDFENFLLEWKLDLSSFHYFLLPLTGMGLLE